MPEIKIPNNKNKIDEDSFSDKKKDKPKSQKDKGIISAYDEHGNPRKDIKKSNELSKGFKVFVVIIYILGFFLALGIIFLMSQCSK